MKKLIFSALILFSFVNLCLAEGLASYMLGRREKKEKVVNIDKMFKIDESLQQDYELYLQKMTVSIYTRMPWSKESWDKKKVFFGGIMVKDLDEESLGLFPGRRRPHFYKKLGDIVGEASEQEIKDPGKVLFGIFTPDNTLVMTEKSPDKFYVYVEESKIRKFMTLKNLREIWSSEK